MRYHVVNRRLSPSACAALLLLLTAAATWLWAHEGHAPLPTKGVQVDIAKGQIVLSPESRDALDVQSTEVGSRPVPQTVVAYATLVAPWQRHAFASSRLPGRIVKLHVQAGDRVEAGQVLAEVQSLDLENLQLELLNARNDVLLSEQIVEGFAKSAGAVPEQESLDAQSRLQQQRNALEIARSKWVSLNLSGEVLEALLREGGRHRLPSLPVHSPVAGTVIHADLRVGKVIEPGEHLFEIVNLSTVWAKIGVLEEDLARVAAGRPVELRLTAYPGEVFHGTVQMSGFALDPRTHENTVWAEFTNPPDREARLRPGMTGLAHIVLPGPETTKTIPAAALINDGLDRYVLVEEASAAGASEYRKRNVVVLRQTPDWVQVQSSDLFPGDRVVTQGSHQLGGFFMPGVLRVSPETARTIHLRVEPVRPQVVEETIEVEGVVDIPPDRRASASPHLPGNLVKLFIDRGQAVRAGQVVAEVASLELQTSQMELLKEHLAFELLDQQYRRLRSAASAVPRRKVLDLESNLNATRNRRDSLRRRLDVVGLSVEQIDGLLTHRQLLAALPVRAPVDGVVVSFDKVIGQMVRAEEPLIEIHDLSRPLVQGFVTERDLARVRVGQTARVRFVSESGVTRAGRVVRSGQVFGTHDQTLAVWVELEPASGTPLRHNQLARITLTVNRPIPTVAVPLGAVVREGTQAFVFVEQEDKTFDRRSIVTGRADDQWVEVTRGLSQGEMIAVQGTAELQTAYASLR